MCCIKSDLILHKQCRFFVVIYAVLFCRVEEAKLHNSALKEKLRLVMEAVLDVEEQAAQIEQLRKEQEQNIKVSFTLTPFNSSAIHCQSFCSALNSHMDHK